MKHLLALLVIMFTSRAMAQVVSGDILGIDPKTYSITVAKPGGQPKTYRTRVSADISIKGGRAKFADLTPGMIIKLRSGEPGYASKIEVVGSRDLAELETNKKVTAFCEQNRGKQVGNGECWTLADEAFKASGLQRPGGDNRVWGRVVDTKVEDLLPGDIVEYRSVKFSTGSFTGPEHTAVISTVADRDNYTVLEQNWGEIKTVRERRENKSQLAAGTIVIYRPPALPTAGKQ